MLLRLLVAAAALLSVPTVAHAAVRGFDGSGRLVVHYEEPRGVLGVEADGTVTPVVETAGMEAAIGSEVIVRDGHVVAAREVQTPPAMTYRTLVLPLTATDSTTTTTPTTRRGTRAPTLTLTPRPGRKAVKLGARRSLRIAARDDKPGVRLAVKVGSRAVKVRGGVLRLSAAQARRSTVTITATDAAGNRTIVKLRVRAGRVATA